MYLSSSSSYILKEFAASRQFADFITVSSSTHSSSPSHFPETFGFYAVTRINPLFVEDSSGTSNYAGGERVDNNIEIARVSETDGAEARADYGTATATTTAVATTATSANNDIIHDLDDHLLPVSVTKRNRGFIRDVLVSARIARRRRRQQRRWSCSRLRSSTDQVDVAQSKQTESPLPRQYLGIDDGQQRYRRRRNQRPRPHPHPHPHRFQLQRYRFRWSRKIQHSIDDEAAALPHQKQTHSRRLSSELIAASHSRITTWTLATNSLYADFALRRVRCSVEFDKRWPSAKSTTWPPSTGSFVMLRRRRIYNLFGGGYQREDAERSWEPRVTLPSPPSSHLSFCSAAVANTTSTSSAGICDISVSSDCGNGVHMSYTATATGTRTIEKTKRISFDEFPSSLFVTNSNLVCVSATTAVAGPLRLIDWNVVRIPEPPQLQLQTPSYGYAVDQFPDFTMDAQQAEKVARKIEDGRRKRRWCRIIMCCIGFAFLLFSLMLFSMMLTRGEKLFGPLQSIY